MLSRMPKFYIEIPHEAAAVACLRTIRILQSTGSHFITNAVYGCKDGDHTARLIMELNDRHEALMLVPQAYRAKAKVVELTTFSVEEVESLLKLHQSSAG
jgi:hypothetical protein